LLPFFTGPSPLAADLFDESTSDEIPELLELDGELEITLLRSAIVEVIPVVLVVVCESCDCKGELLLPLDEESCSELEPEYEMEDEGEMSLRFIKASSSSLLLFFPESADVAVSEPSEFLAEFLVPFDEETNDREVDVEIGGEMLFVFV
jgi:hypothetical protein